VILSNPIKWIAQGPDYEYALIHVSLKILVFFEATYLVQFLEVISISAGYPLKEVWLYLLPAAEPGYVYETYLC